MSTVFPSLRDWRRDVSTTPTVRSSRGYRVEVTEGRAARAERLLNAGEDIERVSNVTGLPLFVVNEIADRIVHDELEAEDTEVPIRHQRRREWIAILNDCHLRDAHLVLLQVGENFYAARRYHEAWSVGRLAAVLLLRARWFLMAGKQDTSQDDPDKLLTKLRSYGGIDRETLKNARQCLRWHRQVHKRAECILRGVRTLHDMFGNFGEDATKEPRPVEEARRVYCGKTAPEEPVGV